MTDDTGKEWTGISAMSEVAATMMRAAMMVPLEAMKAASQLQDKAIELMESFVPSGASGASGNEQETSAGAGQPPAAGTSASASPSSATTGATTGWGPVTLQNPVTGWGPMPRHG